MANGRIAETDGRTRQAHKRPCDTKGKGMKPKQKATLIAVVTGGVAGGVSGGVGAALGLPLIGYVLIAVGIGLTLPFLLHVLLRDAGS
jgi:hypothetical protein